MYACNGNLFNHESPVRVRNLCDPQNHAGLARVKVGLQNCVFLAIWTRNATGATRVISEMQWLMLQQDEPDDRNCHGTAILRARLC